MLTHPAKLFADNAVLGEPILDQQPHRLFRTPVSRGDRRQIRLVVHRERLPEIGPDDLARRVGQALRKRETVVELGGWHRPSPSRFAGPSLSPLRRGEGFSGSLPRPACGERAAVKGLLYHLPATLSFRDRR